MRRLRPFILVAFATLTVIDQSALANDVTWTAQPARGQLQRDPSQIPKGKGFLFVPTMTTSRNEPNYQVYQGNREVATGRPGTGVMLTPGSYRVFIGSGATYQMMEKSVQIREGMTSLVKVDWAGLVVDVIDETRTSINETYELFEEESQENYGLGRGVEEERGEAVDTWLLRPGVYNVVKVGENVTTTRRFSVRLLPGELTQLNLVVDSANNNFVGFYPKRKLIGTDRAASNWKTSWELSGSTLFSDSQNTAEDRRSVSLSLQVHNRSRYITPRQFAALRLIVEEGGTKEGSKAFSKSIDKFEFRATYIYRLNSRIGPYLRGVLNTRLFATDELFDEPRDFVKLDTQGNTIAVERGARKVTLSPALFPMELRQGVGINSQMIESFPLNVDLRLGIGARQIYRSDSFALAGNDSVAVKQATSTSSGVEALLITDARIGRFIDLNSEFDLLVQNMDVNSWVFSWENRLRIFLTSFINLDIVADLDREQEGADLQATEQVLLRFSKFL